MSYTPYWDKGAEQDRYNKVIDLVPPSGPAKTLYGELLRAASNIMWDAYNNDFGNNKTGEFNYLNKYLSSGTEIWEPLRELVAGEETVNLVEVEVEPVLTAMMTYVLDFIEVSIDQPNPEDCHNLQTRPQHNTTRDWEYPWYSRDEDDDWGL